MEEATHPWEAPEIEPLGEDEELVLVQLPSQCDVSKLTRVRLDESPFVAGCAGGAAGAGMATGDAGSWCAWEQDPRAVDNLRVVVAGGTMKLDRFVVLADTVAPDMAAAPAAAGQAGGKRKSATAETKAKAKAAKAPKAPKAKKAKAEPAGGDKGAGAGAAGDEEKPEEKPQTAEKKAGKKAGKKADEGKSERRSSRPKKPTRKAGF